MFSGVCPFAPLKTGNHSGERFPELLSEKKGAVSGALLTDVLTASRDLIPDAPSFPKNRPFHLPLTGNGWSVPG